MSKKGLSLLRQKARPALDSPALVGIADSANSPNQAFERAKAAGYELAYLEVDDAAKARKKGYKLAQACRFLAQIKRDYGKAAFDQTVLSAVSNRPQGGRMTVDTGKSNGEAQ